jgi:cytoskeletal protein RodZ
MQRPTAAPPHKAHPQCLDTLSITVAAAAAVQVTNASVRLVASSSGTLLAEWSPAAAANHPSSSGNSGGSSITLAAASPCQVLVAAGGGRLWLLDITEDGRLVEVAGTIMESEVACLDVTPVGRC